MNKKLFIVFALLIISLQANAQVTFIGFDNPICNSAQNSTYTYKNFSLGGSSPNMYYEIYRNGAKVGGGSENCRDMTFINDSVGFLIDWDPGICQHRVKKTRDYGKTWTIISNGECYVSYYGMYAISTNYVYIVGQNQSKIFISSFSETEKDSYKHDDSVKISVYKTDTIAGGPLCDIDTLRIKVKNNTDTITYYIKLVSGPLGIKEQSVSPIPFTLYPNPACSYFSLKETNVIKSTVSLLTMQGQLIKSYSEKEITENNFPLNNINSGLYLIRIRNNQKDFYSKLLISN